jgi:hypothetical protein
MNRREFITLLFGAVAGWPVAARAQQTAVPVVGFLNPRSPEDTAHLVAMFQRGLAESGYVDGQNVKIEYRWALGQYDRLPAYAVELARRPRRHSHKRWRVESESYSTQPWTKVRRLYQTSPKIQSGSIHHLGGV